MRSLVVFYSMDGNTRLIAHAIADAVGADILELRIKDKGRARPKGFMRYLWAGQAVFMKSLPELESLDKDAGDYDVLFIGSPVWAGTYAPPVRSFLEKVSLSGKDIGLFCCYGGGKGKVFENMRSALSGNNIVGEIACRDPLKRAPEKSVALAVEWARSIIAK